MLERVEMMELMARVSEAARALPSSAPHVVTVVGFGDVPTVVLAGASEMFRGAVAFGAFGVSSNGSNEANEANGAEGAEGPMVMDTLSGVQFPGPFVYDTEEATRWVCQSLTGAAAHTTSARLAAAVHHVIDYWGILFLRPRVEDQIAELVDHTDAAAVWHYARERVGPSARARCAEALAATMFVAAEVELLDTADVLALVETHQGRTLTLFHGLRRWLRSIVCGADDESVAALGAIYCAVAECAAASFFSTGNADLDTLDTRWVEPIVLEILGRAVTGKRKRYGRPAPIDASDDETKCTAPDGAPPHITVRSGRSGGTIALRGVDLAQTSVCPNSVHFARGTLYVVGSESACALSMGPLGPDGASGASGALEIRPIAPIEATAVFEHDGTLYALDCATWTFRALRDGAWRDSSISRPHEEMRVLLSSARQWLTFVSFNGRIYAMARSGDLFRYTPWSTFGWEKHGTRFTNAAIFVAGPELLVATSTETVPVHW